VTGVSLVGSRLEAKRLDMLHRLLPTAAVIGALVNPNYPDGSLERREMEDGARAIGLEIHIVNVTREQEFEAAFAALADAHVRALLVAPMYSS
jgi:putative ABC transport system substrate-binding protein